jgi:hypothetical protein
MRQSTDSQLAQTSGSNLMAGTFFLLITVRIQGGLLAGRVVRDADTSCLADIEQIGERRCTCKKTDFRIESLSGRDFPPEIHNLAQNRLFASASKITDL